MTDKLKDIREGDTVEAAIKGTVLSLDASAIEIAVEGGDPSGTVFGWRDIESPHFSIKKVEKPLEAGDKVRFRKSVSAAEGVILTIDNPCGGAPYYVVRMHQNGGFFWGAYRAEELERI